MPLDLATLNADLVELATNPTDSFAGQAAAWAGANENHVKGIIPILVDEGAAATVVLEAQLVTAFTAMAEEGATPAGNAVLLEAAFVQYAAQLIIPPNRDPLYTHVVPPAPVGFAPLFAAGASQTIEEFATSFSSLIDIWMKTGTSTLIAPPFTVVNWS